jgi:hypothetical protein
MTFIKDIDFTWWTCLPHQRTATLVKITSFMGLSVIPVVFVLRIIEYMRLMKGWYRLFTFTRLNFLTMVLCLSTNSVRLQVLSVDIEKICVLF